MALLLALSPLHAFLITWLKYGLNAHASVAAAASMWREGLVLLIILIIALETAVKRTAIKLDLLDLLILAFIALALAFLPDQWNDLQRWLLGFRFDVLPIVFLFAVRRAEWGAKDKLLKVVLISASVVLAFGILQSLALPQNFLTRFGYSAEQARFTPDRAITGCQHIEGTDRVCRASATFGGPTRYGTYLMLILGLAATVFASRGKRLQKSAGIDIADARAVKIWVLALIALALANIILTYSRSIWIGTMAMGIFGALSFTPHGKETQNDTALRKRGLAIFAFGIIALTITIGIAEKDFLRTVFVREISTDEHYYLARQGAITAMRHPLGLGLGVSGPATARMGAPSLTENWFIQIAVELGIAGLALFLAILFVLFRTLLKSINPTGKGLAFALLGISAAGLFTHSFEETSTILMLFGLAGIIDKKN